MHPALLQRMSMQNGIKALVATSSILLAFAVKATSIYVNPLGEENSSAALSLQGIIDARGNTLINVDNDQLDAGVASAWTSTGNSSGTVVDAVAESANISSFGIYDIADPSQKIQLFSGAQGGNFASIVSPWSEFGFYLINPDLPASLGKTWYSDPSLNGGQAHVVTYQGQGETLNLGSDPNNPVGSVLLGSNSYLMGWENQDFSVSDFDYNDFIVVISNVQPAPDNFETVGLLGMAMLGLVFFQKVSAIRWNQSVKASAKSQRRF
jgi:hypothetical protein